MAINYTDILLVCAQRSQMRSVLIFAAKKQENAGGRDTHTKATAASYCRPKEKSTKPLRSEHSSLYET